MHSIIIIAFKSQVDTNKSHNQTNGVVEN